VVLVEVGVPDDAHESGDGHTGVELLQRLRGIRDQHLAGGHLHSEIQSLENELKNTRLENKNKKQVLKGSEERKKEENVCNTVRAENYIKKLKGGDLCGLRDDNINLQRGH